MPKTQIATTRHPNLKEYLTQLREFRLDDMFETRVLGRAYEVEVNESTFIDDFHLEATAVGSTHYKVELRWVENKILANCTCPYDKNCKHVAAVILKDIRRSSY